MGAAIEAQLESLPRELIVAQAREARRDAHRVGLYLSEFFAALGRPLRGVNRYPLAFLLELAAALRLLEWESLGLVRQCMGLPRAEDTLHAVVLNCASPNPDLPLSKLVACTYIDYFSWLAAPMIGADVLLDPASEQKFADAIATFVWKHRKSIGSCHGTENRT
jgi:hypothetical protein